MGIGKLIQTRNIGRWIIDRSKEPSSQEGAAIAIALASSFLGVPQEIVTMAVGAVATKMVIRAERPKDGQKL